MNKSPPIEEVYRRVIFAVLTPDEQFKLAGAIASNVGYKLVRDGDLDPTPESVDRLDPILKRIERLEAAVLELNPGLNWP